MSAPHRLPRLIRVVGLRCSLASGLLFAASGPSTAMVGAAPADPALSASIVMVLSHQGHAAGFCSAIVLAPDVVLTAAHCVPDGADVRVHPPGDPAHPVMLSVARIARNPGYRADAIKRRERSIDLALVQTAMPLPPPAKPVELASSGAAAEGDRFVAAGYGVTTEGKATTSGVLRVATLKARLPLSPVLLWAEGSGQDPAGACTGDSGGPVMQAGSTAVSAVLVWSAGTGNRTCGALTQAAWIAPQRPWIADVLARWHDRAQP